LHGFVVIDSNVSTAVLSNNTIAETQAAAARDHALWLSCCFSALLTISRISSVSGPIAVSVTLLPTRLRATQYPCPDFSRLMLDPSIERCGAAADLGMQFGVEEGDP